MGLFSRRQKQPGLPSDIIRMMERFGRYEFNPQTSEIDPVDIGQLVAELYQFASADPDGFLVALAEAVIPVGGWAVYGASCILWECFGSNLDNSLQNSSYHAIMNAAIEFLRANGVPPMRVKGYIWQYWVNNGGTSDTWIPRRPIPSQVVTKPANVPNSPEAWVEAGIAHMQNGRFAEAVAACDQALQLNPAYVPAYAHKGAALTELDRYTEALAAYDRALQLDSANPGFYASKGSVLAWLKRYEEALAYCDRALQLDPAYAPAYTNKGIALTGLNQFQEALTFYDRALQLGSTNAGIYTNKANLLVRLNRYAEALEACERALQLDPTNAAAYANKGMAFAHLMRYEEALAAFDRALKLDPAEAMASGGKDAVLTWLNRYAK